MPLTTDRSSSDQARVFVLPKNKLQSTKVSYSQATEYAFWQPVDRHIFESSVSVILSGYSKQEARDLSWFIHQSLVALIEARKTSLRGRTYLSKLTVKALKGLRHHSGINSSDAVELIKDVFELRTKTIGAIRLEDMFVTLKEAEYKGRVLRFLYPDEKTGVLRTRRVKVKRVNTDDFTNVWFDAESYVKDDGKNRLGRKERRFRRYRLSKASEILLEETPVRKLQAPLVIVSSIARGELKTSVQGYESLTSVATY